MSCIICKQLQAQIEEKDRTIKYFQKMAEEFQDDVKRTRRLMERMAEHHGTLAATAKSGWVEQVNRSIEGAYLDAVDELEFLSFHLKEERKPWSLCKELSA